MLQQADSGSGGAIAMIIQALAMREQLCRQPSTLQHLATGLLTVIKVAIACTWHAVEVMLHLICLLKSDNYDDILG